MRSVLLKGIGVALAVAVVGCAAGRWDGSIPVGEWEGTGYYVFSGEVRDDSYATSQPVSVTGDQWPVASEGVRSTGTGGSDEKREGIDANPGARPPTRDANTPPYDAARRSRVEGERDSRTGEDGAPGQKRMRIRGSEYRTSLSIRPVGDGRDAVELRVRSEHGDDGHFNGEDVFVFLELEKAKQVADDCVAYRMVRGGLWMEEVLGEYDLAKEAPTSQPSDFSDAEAVPIAACFRRGGETELVLFYPAGPPFESIRFRRGGVIKSGSYAGAMRWGSDDELIFWREELERKK